jgi:hypothetical protein
MQAATARLMSVLPETSRVPCRARVAPWQPGCRAADQPNPTVRSLRADSVVVVRRFGRRRPESGHEGAPEAWPWWGAAAAGLTPGPETCSVPTARLTQRIGDRSRRGVEFGRTPLGNGCRNVLPGGQWLGPALALTLTGCVTAQFAEPISSFEKSLSTSGAAIAVYYTELNRYERDLYLDRLAFNPDETLKFEERVQDDSRDLCAAAR